MNNNNPYGNNQYGQQQQPQDLFPSLWGSQEDFERATTTCLARVFMRMFAALLVTAAISFGIYQTPAALTFLTEHPFLTLAMVIVQFAVVMILAFRVMKMSPTAANIMFFIYAILTGITFSFLFITYDIGTIFQAFAISALMFGAMSIYGTITKRDLTKIGSFLRMALIGLIIASIVSFFFRNSPNFDTMTLVINYIGVLIFIGHTAYDVQRIKNMLGQANEQNAEEAIRKISVLGALILYLDFINLFLRILAILGRRR